MDNTYRHPSSEALQPPGYPPSSYNNPRPPPPTGMTANASVPHATWTPSQMHYPPPPPPPGTGGYGGPPLPYPYAFDPSVPPPPLGCPPPGFPPLRPPPPSSVPPQYTHANYGTGYSMQQSNQRQDYQVSMGAGSGYSSVQLHSIHKQEDYQGFSRGKEKDYIEPPPEDETSIQRTEDQKWIKEFLEGKGKLIDSKQTSHQQQPTSVSDMKNALCSTTQLVTQLSTLCEDLKLNVDNQIAWTESYLKALEMKREIQDRLKILSDNENLQRVKNKLATVAKRRARRLRARNRQQMEEQHREAEIAEKEAAIEKWRMKIIHAEEEKKKEQELKLAADSVLCEVRKKQADVKRMHDILKSLEKLRKLRKEAASRKGIFTDKQSDDAFTDLLEKLRSVLKKRTVVYGAEEKALMVMLEGEQQEERRRDQETRLRREMEKQLQKKHRIDGMLFGDDVPADPFMQSFRQYYTQAEHSLPALVQIRREWDVFLVTADHPEASAVPQSWVLPDPPSDQSWASSFHTSDTEDI